MQRALVVVFGIVMAAIGGVVAYRAYFLEPSTAVVISNEGVRELPNTARVIGGLALLLVGAAVAFLAALKGRDSN